MNLNFIEFDFNLNAFAFRFVGPNPIDSFAWSQNYWFIINILLDNF